MDYIEERSQELLKSVEGLNDECKVCYLIEAYNKELNNDIKYDIACMLFVHYKDLGMIGEYFYWQRNMAKIKPKNSGELIYCFLNEPYYYDFYKFNMRLKVQFLENDNKMLRAHIESSPDGKYYLEARDEWSKICL